MTNKKPTANKMLPTHKTQTLTHTELNKNNNNNSKNSAKVKNRKEREREETKCIQLKLLREFFFQVVLSKCKIRFFYRTFYALLEHWSKWKVDLTMSKSFAFLCSFWCVISYHVFIVNILFYFGYSKTIWMYQVKQVHFEILCIVENSREKYRKCNFAVFDHRCKRFKNICFWSSFWQWLLFVFIRLLSIQMRYNTL